MSLKDNFKNMFAFFQDKFGNQSSLEADNAPTFDNLIEADNDIESWSARFVK